jgi:hypothetical protein
MQMQRICIVSFYIGDLPQYMSFFIDSARRNSTVDFLIFNDTIRSDRQEGNIRFIKIKLSDFNILAKHKLELPVHVTSGWKLNEFKPAFGLIFEDYLKDYDFWAWSDIDVIWGDLRQFLTEDLLKGHRCSCTQNQMDYRTFHINTKFSAGCSFVSTQPFLQKDFSSRGIRGIRRVMSSMGGNLLYHR